MLLGINSFNYQSFQKGKFYIDVYVMVQFSNQFHFLKMVKFFLKLVLFFQTLLFLLFLQLQIT